MTPSHNSLVARVANRVWRAALWVIFALVLIIPKLNRLRRNRSMWKRVRVFTACAGGVIMALAILHGYDSALVVFGALLSLFAAVVGPVRAELSIDARARELGALIAVDGGRYCDSSGRSHRAKLFVAPDRLWVLNGTLEVLLELPVQQIRSLAVEAFGDDWTFRMNCEDISAEFVYEGSFAEHLARVAEATLSSRLRRELPILH